MNFFVVAVGGGLGAALRYGVNVGAPRIFGGDYPWHTLIVNVLGCFVMGVLSGMAVLKFNLTQEMRLFLMTGILGGFTTFSSFALDFVVMAERRDVVAAGGYAFGSVVLSIAACFAGLAMVRSIFA